MVPQKAVLFSGTLEENLLIGNENATATEMEVALKTAQAQAIVDMRLGQLTGLRIEELKQQYEDLMKLIDYYKQILADDALCMKVVKDELIEIKDIQGNTFIDYFKIWMEEYFKIIMKKEIYQ